MMGHSWMGVDHAARTHNFACVVCSCLIFRDGVEYVGEGRERFVDVLCLGQSFAFDRRPDGNGWMFGVSDQMYW